MQKTISIRLLPSEAANEQTVKEYIAATAAISVNEVAGFHIQKSSIDARGRQAWINLTLQAFINEPFQKRSLIEFKFQDVSLAKKKVVVIGAGPAGLFAALKLIELGIQPILLERGKDVRARRRDLATLNKEGKVNPESNYCFGEGGAGTYSDGKLYTRSSKRGNIQRILQLFTQFGAEEKILYQSHPHIGTNKLPQIITAMRQQIINCGAAFLFEKKVVDFVLENGSIKAVKTSDDDLIAADAFILATGHSARDMFELLQNKNILLEAKPFALGVRVEHPQNLIDNSQYHCLVRDRFLPPASYSLVQQINNKGVFSFCMCPGGIIAPAATAEAELVVNGWSPSKRDNPYANSGIVATVDMPDLQVLKKHGDFESICNKPLSVLDSPLGMLYFQQYVERKSFVAGGGKFVAPAQRLADFCENKISQSLPACSYLPGVQSTHLKNVLPAFIQQSLQQAFKEFGKKIKGYYSNDAIVVATESRTSSPVKIPRNAETLQHPQFNNLYPCGEGAGYAGGIVSAAMDGERVAEMIALLLH